MEPLRLAAFIDQAVTEGRGWESQGSTGEPRAFVTLSLWRGAATLP